MRKQLRRVGRNLLRTPELRPAFTDPGSASAETTLGEEVSAAVERVARRISRSAPSKPDDPNKPWL